MPHSYLKRLPIEFYKGRSHVFWTLCTKNRKTGWLDQKFLHQSREILLHSAWRYQVAIPVFCFMPDHFHLIMSGLSNRSDQRKAIQFFRRESTDLLLKPNNEWQLQAHDHVLREKELNREAFSSTLHYILQNPARKSLVQHAEDWEFSGCIIPGFPRTNPNYDTIWKHLQLSSKCCEAE